MNDLIVLDLVDNFPVKVEEHEGISTCPKCGTRYVGMQLKCTKKVPKIRSKDSWYGFNHLSDRDDEHKRNPMLFKFIYEECGSRPTWDLYDKKQHFDDFNNFTKDLQYVLSLESNYFRFKHHLTEEAKSKLVETYHDRVVALESKMREVMGAINEMANKINDAGESLRF